MHNFKLSELPWTCRSVRLKLIIIKSWELLQWAHSRGLTYMKFRRENNASFRRVPPAAFFSNNMQFQLYPTLFSIKAQSTASIFFILSTRAWHTWGRIYFQNYMRLCEQVFVPYLLNGPGFLNTWRKCGQIQQDLHQYVENETFDKVSLYIDVPLIIYFH